MNCKILENNKYKLLRSENFNYNFDKELGYMESYGKTVGDDPGLCKFGPTICDWELSTICHANCAACYKKNTNKGKNISFNQFKRGFKKLPKTITQIAYGIGDIDSHPDLFKILKYTRKNGIVPNITINGFKMTNELYEKLAAVCGAVAVSHYNDDACFNSVEKLSSFAGKEGYTIRDVNIHKILSEETYESCHHLLDAYSTDKRLSRLNAIVFLHLKKKGRGEGMNTLSSDKYNILMNRLFDEEIRFGLDSCGAKPLSDFIVENNKDKELLKMIQSCESTLESIYINVEGKVFPCSFLEDQEGIDIYKAESFVKDIWFNEKIINFRKELLETTDNNKCRSCPRYKIIDRV